ncbi:hypothetical protein ZWY2020_025141 [Hordeum vulgare]|nr:hypothetical protein ZWY2020_025141 [Hordeum vulgare]
MKLPFGRRRHLPTAPLRLPLRAAPGLRAVCSRKGSHGARIRLFAVDAGATLVTSPADREEWQGCVPELGDDFSDLEELQVAAVKGRPEQPGTGMTSWTQTWQGFQIWQCYTWGITNAPTLQEDLAALQFHWLQEGRKYSCFDLHRQFLDPNHQFRKTRRTLPKVKLSKTWYHLRWQANRSWIS